MVVALPPTVPLTSGMYRFCSHAVGVVIAELLSPLVGKNAVRFKSGSEKSCKVSLVAHVSTSEPTKFGTAVTVVRTAFERGWVSVAVPAAIESIVAQELRVELKTSIPAAAPPGIVAILRRVPGVPRALAVTEANVLPTAVLVPRTTKLEGVPPELATMVGDSTILS